jgi:ubiquinone/menaquinone biosynthesis C-methylase UbiE
MATMLARRQAEGYRRVIGPVTARLVAQLAIGPGDGRRAVDLGCGDGEVAAGLASRGWDCVALDRSPVMAAIAAERLGVARVAVADAHRIPLATGTADLVLMAFLTAHLDDPPKAMAEVRRVLRKDGRVAVLSWGEDDKFLGLPTRIIHEHGNGEARRRLAAAQRRAGAQGLGEGFDRIETKRLDTEVRMRSADEWWRAVLRASAGLSALWPTLAAPARAAARRQFEAEAEQFRQGDEIVSRATAVALMAG